MDQISSLFWNKKKFNESSTITTRSETPRLRPRKSKKKSTNGIDIEVSEQMPLISVPRPEPNSTHLAMQEEPQEERLATTQNLAREDVNLVNVNGQPSGKELQLQTCLLYTSPSPRDRTRSRMPSSA